MSAYIVLAIVAYLLLAVKGVMDKFLLNNKSTHARAMAFYIGITSVAVLPFLPFVRFDSLGIILVAILGGVFFLYALYFLFEAIKRTSVSRVLPVQGGLVPIFTLLFAYFLIDERLSMTQYGAFGLLVLGAVLIAIKWEKDHFEVRGLSYAVIASLLFGLSHVLSKYVYIQYGFVSGLVFVRVGVLLAACSLLLSKENRSVIFRSRKKSSKKNIKIFFGGHLIGVSATLLQGYAISIGTVSIVNALQGLQDFFVLALSIILTKNRPEIIKEKVTHAIVVQKVIAIILISFGLILLM